MNTSAYGTGKSKRSEGRKRGGTGHQKVAPKVEEKQEGGKRDAVVLQGEVQVMEDHPQAMPQEENSGGDKHPPPPKIGNNDMRQQGTNKRGKQINGVRRSGAQRSVSLAMMWRRLW